MATNYINTRIKQKYDTKERWEAANPVLLKGEIALVMMGDDEILQMKVGDGVSHFNDLEYAVNKNTLIRDWTIVPTE